MIPKLNYIPGKADISNESKYISDFFLFSNIDICMYSTLVMSYCRDPIHTLYIHYICKNSHIHTKTVTYI